MSDDAPDTLDALGRALAPDGDDPAWQALAEGRIDAETAIARAEVAPDEGAVMAALFAPLDDAALDRIEQAIEAPQRTAEPPGLVDALESALSGGEHDPDDPVWQALAEGRLGDDARSELAADDARLAAVFAPLDDAALDRIDRAVGATAEGAPAERPAPVGARVLQFPKRRWIAPVVGLALAAAALVVALRPTPTTLPRYAIELSGGDQAVRSTDGAAAERAVFRPDSTLDLVLRPATTPSEPPTAEVELVGADGAQPVALPLQIEPTGAVLYSGPAAPLFGPTTGDFTLRVTVRAGDAEQVVERPIRLIRDTP